MPFNVPAALKDGATKDEIASFLSKKFDYNTDEEPETVISKLSTLSAGDVDKLADNEALDKALDVISDTKENEDGLYKFPTNKFNKCLPDYAKASVAKRIMEFTDQIKLVEKLSVFTIEQARKLSGTPLGRLAFQTIDMDGDIKDDIKNPFFIIKLVNSARHVPGYDKHLFSMLQATKGKLNNMIAASAMNALLSDAKPKYVKMATDAMKAKVAEEHDKASKQPEQPEPQKPAPQQQQPQQQPQMQGIQQMLGR